MLEAIKQNGGFVSCHAHFDKAFYITKDRLEDSNVDMEKKWNMSDDIKRKSTEEEIANRIRIALDIMVAQGVQLTATFVDAYEAVGHKAIYAALKVKEEYKNKIKMPVHVHIDQENNPNERDTQKLIAAVERHSYQGRTVAIHAVSTSAQPKEYRHDLYKKMADLGIAVVVCPSAMLSQKQFDQFLAPGHNSIANVPEMLEAGVLVGLGVDNIADFYLPFVDGDMWTELRMLQETCRYHDFDQLVKIASVNGAKILKYR